MLPAATDLIPAAVPMAAASAVTVDLPFVPVTPSTRTPGDSRESARAATSTSPTTSIPRWSAATRSGSRSARPGLATTASTPSRSDGSKAPSDTRTSGCSSRTVRRAGGAARVSAARSRAPYRASHRTLESPVSPNPRTRTSFACQSSVISLGIRGSSQFQRRQAEEDQHHRDDPEPHDDLVFLPALQFVVVVQRRHAKDALAGQLERSHLDDHGERLDHEHAAHDQQHDLLSHDERDHPERRA